MAHDVRVQEVPSTSLSSAAARVITRRRRAAATVGVRDGMIVAVAPYDAPLAAARRSTSPTTRCCCPASSTPTCMSTSRAHRVGGFRQRHPAAAAGGVTTHRRHAAQLHPADRRRRRRWRSSARRPRASATSTSASGAVLSRQPRRPAPRCTKPACSVSSASCCTRASTSSRRWTGPSSRQAMREISDFDGLLIVHAEDAARHRPRRRRRRARATPTSSPPARATPRTGAIAQVHRARRGVPAPGAHPAPVERRRAAGDRRRAGRRRPRHRGDLPALPDVHRRGDPDGATQFKCCPPIREAANRDLLWRGAARRDDRLRGLRPLAVARPSSSGSTPATSAWPGAGSPRCSWACRRCGPRPEQRASPCPTSPRWMSSARPRQAGLRRKGAHRRGHDADFCVFAPDESFVVDPARLHHQQPDHAVRRTRARRRRPQHLAARRARSTSTRRAARAAPDQRRDMTTDTPPTSPGSPTWRRAARRAASSTPTTSCSPSGRT